jgi:hypothetical protein
MIGDTPTPTELPELPLLPASKPNLEEALILEPMQGPVTAVTVTEALLRHPGRLVHAGQQPGNTLLRKLSMVTGGSLLIFGLILGTYSGGQQLWAVPLKLLFGTAVASAICFPSLYIFSALDGLQVRLSHLATLLLTTLALTSLLLLGFAPVVWVFCVSTDSLPFIGALVLAFWLIGLYFGRRLLTSAARAIGAPSSTFIRVWLVIFTIVTLQMSTSLRPLIGTAETLLPKEKQFFLEHWVNQISDDD